VFFVQQKVSVCLILHIIRGWNITPKYNRQDIYGADLYIGNRIKRIEEIGGVMRKPDPTFEENCQIILLTLSV
jgi:hypothetical protein